MQTVEERQNINTQQVLIAVVMMWCGGKGGEGRRGAIVGKVCVKTQGQGDDRNRKRENKKRGYKKAFKLYSHYIKVKMFNIKAFTWRPRFT